MYRQRERDLLEALTLGTIVFGANREVVHVSPSIQLVRDPSDRALDPFEKLIDSGLKGIRFDLNAEIDWFPETRVRMRGEPLPSGELLIAFERSQESSEVEELRNRIREIEFITSRLQQGIWRLSPDGVILEVNPYLATMLEMKASLIVGQKASEFAGEKLRCETDADGKGSYEAIFLTRSGRVRRVSVTSTPLFGSKGELRGAVELITDVTEEHAMHSKLVQEVLKMQLLANLDPLTQLGNRRAFDMALSHFNENAAEKPFGMIMLDLNGLKDINDSLGHIVGDAAIRTFGDHLKSRLRDGDVLARIGGDEFAVLVKDVSFEELVQIGERVRLFAKASLTIDGLTIELVASVGWAHSSQSNDHLALFADRSMYAHKRVTRKRKAAGA